MPKDQCVRSYQPPMIAEHLADGVLPAGVMQPEGKRQQRRRCGEDDSDEKVVANFRRAVHSLDDRPAELKDSQVDLLDVLFLPDHTAHCHGNGPQHTLNDTQNYTKH